MSQSHMNDATCIKYHTEFWLRDNISKCIAVFTSSFLQLPKVEQENVHDIKMVMHLSHTFGCPLGYTSTASAEPPEILSAEVCVKRR